MDGDSNNSDNDDKTEEEDITPPLVGNPKSQMTDYVTQFLARTSSEEDGDAKTDNCDVTLENISDATHLIAVPMDSSFELLIELESVQRAILHHCPILFDACVTGSTTRLPLLYVQAPGALSPQKSMSVTGALARTVQLLVKKHMFDDGDQAYPETKSDEELNNSEGYRPLSMTFQSLEIDGDNNNILNTVGTFSEGENYVGEKRYNQSRFENFMRDLQSSICKQGWKMSLPFDLNQDHANNEKNDVKSFRPRIAFMELPATFDENISKFKNKDTEITEEDMKFLTAEEGGNGISPIFWCNYWDDVFAKNVRLPEIGIYPRSPVLEGVENTGLTTNSLFRFPFETIALPNGNNAMLMSEKKFSDYNNERLEKEEEKFRRENRNDKRSISESVQESHNPLSSTSSKSTEPDLLMSKTRNRLENIYMNSGSESSTYIENKTMFDSTQDRGDTIDIVDTNNSKVFSHKDDYMEDWMKNRIKAAQDKPQHNDDETMPNITQYNGNKIDSVEARETSSDNKDDYVERQERIKKRIASIENSKKVKDKDDEPKYSIQDNPVFKAYKDGTLTTNRQNRPNVSRPTKKLGRYPSNDHFVGIWQVLNSPVGVGRNNDSNEGSENLILRVDGTTAAGPTLNSDTNQKASGGTWKMFVQENGDVVLRIRLVVPPEKNRIIVMESLVERGSQVGVKLASRNFSIPQINEKEEAGKIAQDALTCSGEAYIEDAITRKNKLKLEFFSLIKKRNARDFSDYTITIPKTIKRLD